MLRTEMNRDIFLPGCILTVGGDPITLTAFGKTYRFEWHTYCGPMFVNKKGDPTPREPKEKDPWWKAFGWWDRQGKRTENGVCIWDEVPVCPACHGTKIGEWINKRNAFACKACKGTGEGTTNTTEAA